MNYTELVQLHEKYEPQGLRVLAFPCNQFGGQVRTVWVVLNKVFSCMYGIVYWYHCTVFREVSLTSSTVIHETVVEYYFHPRKLA